MQLKKQFPRSIWPSRRTVSRVGLVLAPLALAFSLLLYQISIVQGAAGLTVEILAGYNLVVDSNISSPSTYGPSVATVAARFCNPATNADTLKDVVGYIGNYTGDLATSTPGVYPIRSSGGAFDLEHPLLAGSGSYAFTHLGSAVDAARYIGDLAPGQCSVQYWSFTYPRCEGNQNPPCTQDPVWGAPTNPADDLYLYFDVWGRGTDNSGGTPTTKIADATHRMTMRNEISANANKIEPNPDGAWFNTDTSTVYPGDVITTNGVNYTFGNVNQGFDNDSDGAFDNNAWMQPFGSASYDPGCFRLVRTTGTLTVTRSGGNPPMILNFKDQLYFTNLPADNTNVTGRVYYTFLALGGACTTAMTPYQEAASGADNEKFNGDYGAGIPPLQSFTSQVSVDKNGNASVTENATITYNIPFTNLGDTDVGLTLSSGIPVNMPFTLQDTVPDGLSYVCRSASASLAFTPDPDTDDYTLLYSKDSGLTWSTTETALWSECATPGTPTTQVSAGPNNRIVLQWRLNAPLPRRPASGPNTSTGTATFQARVPGNYIISGGAPFIENTSCANLGGATTNLDCGTATTMISSNASISGAVWEDRDNNGFKAGAATEPGILGANGVTVTLYWDRDGDGQLDSTDPRVTSAQTTSTSYPNYNFTGLAYGNYLIVVEAADSDIPTGFRPTTPTILTASLSTVTPTATNKDFGFGPTLKLIKDLISPNASLDGGLATFRIQLFNQLPGDGTSNAKCRYTAYATIVHPTTGLTPPGGGPTNAQFTNPDNARYSPDGAFAQTGMRNNADTIGLSGFTLGAQLGNIDKVEYIVYAREIANFVSSDEFIVRAYYNDASISTDAQNTYNGTYFSGQAGTDYVLRKDITALRTWTWADFSGDATDAEIQLYANGAGGASGDLAVDAVAYVITTNQTCGGVDSTILTLPVTDTYDADLMTFVSAVPAHNNAYTTGAPNSTLGTVTWNNLGPLYPGETKTITATFRIKEPSADTSQNIDTATATNAYFTSGRRTNDASDTAEVARPSITGRIFSNVASYAWQPNTGYGAGDTFVPNVTVRLWACYDSVANQIIFPGENTNENCGEQDTTSGNNVGVWQQILTDTTDVSGNYVFAGLAQGYYYVTVDPNSFPQGAAGQTADPSNLTPGSGTGASPCGAACDNTWGNSGAGLNTTNFNPINLPDEDIANINFGYTVPATIFGNLWNDINGNGARNTGEGPLAGVTVEIYNGACTVGVNCPTTTTNASGYYRFTNLAPGSYQVFVRESTLLPAGTWTQTVDPDESGVCVVCDERTTTSITLVANQVAGAYDFAYTQTGTASLGDLVFRDWDGDGVQDSGEEGISGLAMRLYRDINSNGVIDPTDALVRTYITDASGGYNFNNLPDGAYMIQVSQPPTSTLQTLDPDGTLDHTARNIVISGGGASITINGTGCAGAPNCQSVDFAYRPHGDGVIGDLVWRDANGNGNPDPGEAGISGVLVRLYEDDGDGVLEPGVDALVTSATTGVSGGYSFTGLSAGRYLVVVDPSNFSTGGPLENLSQLNGTHNNLWAVTLDDGQIYNNADFGYGNSAMGGTLWQDNNGNGTQDFGEAGIANVEVTLYRSTDGGATWNPYAADQTDASGLYLFTGLMSGDYRVEVTDSTNRLTNFTLTYDPDAYSTNPAKPFPPCSPTDTDYQGCDEISTTQLLPGATDLGHDFGYQPRGPIGDMLWIDLDGDGGRDAAEPGIADVTVWLYLDDGDGIYDPSPGGGDTLQQTTVTDLDGLYSFGDNPSGTYFVVFDTADPDLTGLSLTQTFEKNITVPSSPDNITKVRITGGAVDQINDQPGTALEVDFGFQYNGNNTLNGTVFFDNNQNGTQDTGEDTTFANIPVNLWNCGPDGLCNATADNFFIGSTITNGTGGYAFGSLPDGVYSVSIDGTAPAISEMTLTSASPQTVSLDPTHASTSGVTETRNFGLYAYMDCGDLPNPYNYRTLLDREGPCHVSPATPNPDHLLGAIWDNDFNGQGTTGPATGDDNSGSDDEDGVNPVDFALWSPNSTRQIQVTVVGNNAYLAGWFDWNDDYDFVTSTGDYDPGEYVYFGQVAPGLHPLDVPIPACAATCFTDDPNHTLYARFRLYRGSSPPPVISPTGMVVNGEVEDYQWSNSPTALTLVDFHAAFQPTRVAVQWQTALEIDAIGFNLYRATSLDGERTRLNVELIPSQAPGGIGGASYEFIDPDTRTGVTYYYWLVFVDVSGETTFGPVVVVLENPVYLPFVQK